MFDFSSIKDFDRHIDLSIPNYSGMIDIFTALSLEYMPPNGTCVDLGCSTGSFIKAMSERIDGNYHGIDVVSFPEWYTEKNDVNFVNTDLIEGLQTIEQADLVTSLFTLQFLGAVKRKQVIQHLWKLITRGATLFLAEKVYSKSAKINTVLAREHYRTKRLGFNDTDILDKDYALLGSMFPLTHDEMEDELQYLGTAEQVWQSYNFKGWVITR